MKSTRSTLYPAIVSAFGALFGFVITAMSIILTWTDRAVPPTPVEGRLQATLACFRSAVRWLGLATIWSVFALLFDKDDNAFPFVWCGTLFMILIVCIRLVRCVWVLKHLIALIAPERTQDPTERPIR